MTTNLSATFVLVLFGIFRWIFASEVPNANFPHQKKACDPQSQWNSICREKNAECIVIPGGNNCSCSNGYEMLDEICQITPSYCVKNKAQAVVTITGPLFCECGPDQFFDYSTSQCHTVDQCPFISCKRKFEECQGNTCVCKTGYEKSNGGCQPKNYCLIDNICGDAKCEPGPDDDPKRVRCFCDSGFILTREKSKIYCKLIRCEVGSLNACDQLCSYTSDQKNSVCGCFPGHTRQTDNITCLIDYNKKCAFNSCPSGAVCVENNGERECYCKSGFLLHDNECVDLCSAGKLSNDVCPNECRKAFGGFQCVCTGKYKLSKNMITCEERQMCLEGEPGFTNCISKNRTCIESPSLEEGYVCGNCLYGLELYNGTCTDFCSLDKYKEFCFRNGGTCSSVNFTTERAHCECPPLLTYNATIGCVFAKYSYTTILQILNFYQNENDTLPLDKNTEGWSRLYWDVYTTLTTLFASAISKINVLACRTTNQDIICKIEMQMNFPSASLFHRLTSGKLCKNGPSIPQDVCFLPPFLKLRKNSYHNEDTFKPSRACHEHYGYSMCPVSTKCIDEYIGFSCKCEKGFEATSSTFFSRDGKGEVQMCQDIDECKKEDICPNGTICKNTIGDFECICKPGLVKQNSTLDPKKNACVSVCDMVNCEHGTCSELYFGGYYCKCYDGYSGQVCEIPPKKESTDVDKGKVASIVFAIIEGLMILVLISALIYIYCYRRKIKVPQRGGAVNNAKLKTNKNTISAPLQNLNHVPMVNSQGPRDNQAEQEDAIYADCEYINVGI